MKADEAEALGPDYAALLAAREAALDSSAQDSSLQEENVPPEVWLDLERDMACVKLLRQAFPPGDVSASSALPPGTQASSVLPWNTLGRFQIRRELGRGSFGIVYLAYDPGLGREVALKIPRADALADPDQRHRFQREARAAAGLDHPNLVPVYETGEVGPVCYIASAYCSGITLAHWLKQRDEPVPYRLAAELISVLAEAVDYAHQRGVVHRDLKPGNILLQTTDDTEPTGKKRLGTPSSSASSVASWHPKITDFGLAKFLLGEPGMSAATQTGVIVGTANYMAPEQAGGETRQVGTAADIYALGVILYELLTGRTPFQGDSVLEVLLRVRTEEPLAPGRLRRKVPRDLETICLKCLQKEPAKRYCSASALAEDLRRFLAGKPIEARPIRAWERILKWARRRPAAAALVTVSSLASLLIVTGLVVGIVLIAGALGEKDAALAREEESLDKSEQSSARNAVAAAEREFSAKNWGRGEEFLLECPPKLRHWEWHYLMRLRHVDPIALRAFEPLSMAEGFDLAFDADSRLLAVPSSDNSTKVFDASSGRKVWNLRGDEGGDGCVRSVAFSPNGRLLAAGSDDRSVKIYDTTTGEVKCTCLHNGPVKGVAFNTDGSRLASASCGTNPPWEVRIWDAATGELIHTLPGQAVPNPSNRGIPDPHIVHLAFSANGRWLAAGSVDNTDHTVKVWNVATGKEVYILLGHTDWIVNVAFALDGRQLVSLGRDRRVNVWDLTSLPFDGARSANQSPEGGARRLAPRWTWEPGTNSVSGLAVSPTEPVVAFGGPTADGAVRVYDLTTGERKHVLKGDYRTVSVAFSPDGSRLVSAGYDRTVRVWDTKTGYEVLSLRGYDDIVGRVLFSPDGQRLATACADGTVRIWDATPFDEKSRPHIRTIGGHEGDFTDLDFSPDSGRLATASADGLIEVWDAQTGKLVYAYPGHKEAAVSVAFSPHDGNRLVSGSLDKTAKLWDAQTREALLNLDKDFTVMVRRVAFRPDGKAFATASLRELRLWDLNGRLLLTLPQASPEIVNGMAFSPNGEYVATVGPQETAKVWNVTNGDLVFAFKGHQGTVNCVAFHPKANYLASGGSDNKVWLWTPDSPTEPAIHPPLTGHTDYVQSVAFSPNGKYLASASWKEVIVWDVTNRDNIKRIEKFDRFGGRLAGRIWRAAFGPDGRHLAAASGYKGIGEIEIWDAALWESTP
jgi:WD40 repeat protein/serine/threonine protein kinase